jgi:hypothetical protein
MADLADLPWRKENLASFTVGISASFAPDFVAP